MNKKNKSSEEMRDWRDMSFDVLMRIFMTLNLVDFAAVSMVCSSWRDVCRDPSFWIANTLDLSKWKHPPTPTLSSKIVSLLSSLLNLSNGHAHCLIFQFQIYLDNRDFFNIAQRSPNLKRLVLPGLFPDFTKNGIDLALEQWKGLESLTITNTCIAPLFLEAIGKYCPNFSELKLTCHLTLNIATTLAKHVPKLKVLSVQSVRVNKNALVHVVKKLKELEILNVTHSFVVTGNRPDNTEVHPQHSISTLLKNMPRPPTTLMHCNGFCDRCQDVFIGNMMHKWRDPKEQIWCEDEIPSLQI
ncbi:hypothetical protein K1719_019188 [Acacia pycnantha]|nr:hypothetical protein K1719_019188 [Acacia pycnantha]